MRDDRQDIQGPRDTRGAKLSKELKNKLTVENSGLDSKSKT